ncbi:hypothetical protein CORC01_09074 [Colletotrichum orchidophilum]|uniref:Uncharacterized protein n=1 Tax=Colletotrichum orchidophilum TaxID=1209926 RepID=A0A1G4B2W1_9PEZI|nr:uncharacterized protein CORC01_09074 [Colletotrichum orchidophilum]OHE95642.1 hypothetical protein CORC01_09074 [Colletotrichum orchidophilum]
MTGHAMWVMSARIAHQSRTQQHAWSCMDRAMYIPARSSP